MDKLSNFNPLLFERNLTKDYEDTAKKMQQLVAILQRHNQSKMMIKPSLRVHQGTGVDLV